MEEYGQAYGELRLKSGRKVFLYPSYFYARRLLFALAVLIFTGTITYQVLISALSIVASVIIIGETRPHKS